MGATNKAQGTVQTLPDFERPPLTEVALGVVFEPVEIGAVGLGELYQRWRDVFPRLRNTLRCRHSSTLHRVPAWSSR